MYVKSPFHRVGIHYLHMFNIFTLSVWTRLFDVCHWFGRFDVALCRFHISRSLVILTHSTIIRLPVCSFSCTFINFKDTLPLLSSLPMNDASKIVTFSWGCSQTVLYYATTICSRKPVLICILYPNEMVLQLLASKLDHKMITYAKDYSTVWKYLLPTPANCLLI